MEVGRVTPVRAAAWQVPDGAHGVTLSTTLFAFVGRLIYLHPSAPNRIRASSRRIIRRAASLTFLGVLRL